MDQTSSCFYFYISSLETVPGSEYTGIQKRTNMSRKMTETCGNQELKPESQSYHGHDILKPAQSKQPHDSGVQQQ
jgi:hypothetical protein